MRKYKVLNVISLAFLVITLNAACLKSLNGDDTPAPANKGKAAAAAAPAETGELIPADQLKKLMNATGYTKSQITKYNLDLDGFLNIYATAALSGNSIDSVYDNSDKGKDIASYYKKNNTGAALQQAITTKIAAIKAQVVKNTDKKDTYEGINKDAVADKIVQITSISKYSILDGFGSGIPVNDIYTAAVIASKSGNSFSNILNKRVDDGDFTRVYNDIGSGKKAEVTGVIGAHQSEIDEAAKSGGKNEKKEVTSEMKDSAKKISDVTGCSFNTILDAMKDGNSQDDVIKAIAIMKCFSGDLYNIFRLKKDGGWTKVNTYYGVASMQGTVDKTVSDLNNKINPQEDKAK